MPEAKTRIWRGRKPVPVRSEAPREDRSEVIVQRSICVAGGAAAATSRRATEEPSRSEPTESLPATGFFPIEDLLAEAAKRGDASVETEQAREPVAEAELPRGVLSVWGTWLRRLRAFVQARVSGVKPLRGGAGGASNASRIRRATIVALMLVMVDLYSARHLRPDESASSAPGVQSEDTSPKPSGSEDSAAVPERGASTGSASRRQAPASASPALERAAVDALASGDLARARELYERLAEESSFEVFRQAERVLSRRLEDR